MSNPQVSEEVNAELLLWIGGRDAGNAETGDQANDRKPQEHRARIFLVAFEPVRKVRASQRAGDRGEKGAQFDDAIAPGEAVLRQNFRQQAVFRRTKERALCAR